MKVLQLLFFHTKNIVDGSEGATSKDLSLRSYAVHASGAKGHQVVSNCADHASGAKGHQVVSYSTGDQSYLALSMMASESSAEVEPGDVRGLGGSWHSKCL